MAGKAYIYSYWSKCRRVADDQMNMIIPAIATLRKNTDDRIVVLDYSHADWEYYPKLLNVQIIKKIPFFTNLSGLSDFVCKALSRNLDLWLMAMTLPEDEIVATDSDIFWLTAVGNELDKNKFHIRVKSKGVNNGCYYFCKTGKSGMLFMDYYKTYSSLAAHSESFRKEVTETCGLNYFNDETVCSYTYLKHPELCGTDPFLYNGPLMDADKKWQDYKNIHILHGWLPEHLQQHRGLMAYLFQEISHSIKEILPRDKLSKIKTPFCLPVKDVLTGGVKGLIEGLQQTYELNATKSQYFL